jgi:hypothetical protein
MDVFIKSFNRPYYLERCIRSVLQHLTGDYRITVFDDGTAAIDLDRIQSLFPSLTILYSPDHSVKSKTLEKHILKKDLYTIKTIPISFWRESVEKVQDVFLLLEEDSWLTGPVDVEEVRKIFQDRNIMTLKLSWHGNELIAGGRRLPLSFSYEQTIPKLPLEKLWMARPLIANSLHIKSILTKAGLLDIKFLLPYYSLYTVTAAFFRKEYWLFNLAGASDTVNESLQLLQAVRWRQENPASKFGKSKSEIVKTSFITSSINTRHAPFDMIRLNHHFNTLWRRGELNSVENMPNDFSMEYLTTLLNKISDPDCTSSSWNKWIYNFKQEFTSIGCIVD